MWKINNIMMRYILYLSVIVFVCLSLAAFGGLFDAIMLVYFWYLALFGIASILTLMLMLAVAMLFNVLNREYIKIFESGGGSDSEKKPHHFP